MTAARVFVRAVLVTDGRSPLMGEVLDAISSQRFAPDAIHIVTVGDTPVPTPPAARVIAAPASATYGEAVALATAGFPAHDAEYLWLLHDDCAPEADALAKLAATARKRTRAAVIGAAQVRWNDTSRLLSLGSTVSRLGARRVDLVDSTDINQGQYDFRDDVLAVSLVGALVRRDAWEQLGGVDDAYRGFGDSADFCRRAWRAGHDVVVVPGAHVRHAQLNLRAGREEHAPRARGTRNSYPARRTSEWYHALVWAPLPAVPLLVAWAFGSALVRAAVRVGQNDPRSAFTDLGVPWRVIGRLGLLAGSRRRARRNARLPARAVRPLLATPGAVFAHVRARYMRSYDKWRLAVTPTAMVRAELAAAATRRRWMLGVVVVIAGGFSVAVFGGWLSDLVAGRMLVGSALGVTDVTWHELWERTWSGWSDVGYGASSLDGGFAAALLPLAVLPGGLRLWLGLVLIFGPVAAAVSAWCGAGAATRAVSVRAVAALAYAAWPPFLVSIAQGRVGPALAHIALPFAALGVARALGWHRGEALAHGEEYTVRRIASPSAAAAASLVLAFCVAVTPVMLVPAVAALAVVAVFAGRRWLRVVLIAVPALTVAAPGIQAALRTDSLRDAWAILARDAGPAAASDVASVPRTLLTLDTSPGGSGWFAFDAVVAAIALVACAAAVLALLSGRAPRAVWIGWLVAAIGMAAALASQRTATGWPDSAGGVGANGWSGPGLSLALVGALAASAAASSGVWHGGRTRRARRVGAIIVVGAAAAAVLASATAWSWPTRGLPGDVRTAGVDALPLVAALEQRPPDSARVLTLTDTDAGVAYSVLTTDGAVFATGTAGFGADGSPLARPGHASDPSPADLAGTVAMLVGAGGGGDDELAEWGVGVIVATPGSARSLAGLAQTDTLELMGASELGTAYRVMHDGQAVTRAWIDTGDARVAIAMDVPRGEAQLAAGESGTLVLAVPADHAWQARLNGSPLEAVPDDHGRQAFAVPPGGGELDVRFVDPRYRLLWWAAAIACGLALLAAAPVHERRLVGGRP